MLARTTPVYYIYSAFDIYNRYLPQPRLCAVRPQHPPSMLTQILTFIPAAVIAVPDFKRIGLGSVPGYLAAGLFIGPWGLRIITGFDDILHIAEFGVILLLADSDYRHDLEANLAPF